jgi:hypothetical protein
MGRLRQGLGLVLSAVLALSPVLSTAAQTHEAAHAAQGEKHFHAHASHQVASEQALVHDDDAMPDAGGMLHLLAHAAHACGHAVAILGGVMTAVRADDASVRLPIPETRPRDAPRAHPFRPPIA